MSWKVEIEIIYIYLMLFTEILDPLTWTRIPQERPCQENDKDITPQNAWVIVTV